MLIGHPSAIKTKDLTVPHGSPITTSCGSPPGYHPSAPGVQDGSGHRGGLPATGTISVGASASGTSATGRGTGSHREEWEIRTNSARMA